MLYGRDEERARIGELLDGARALRSGVLALRGEPGVGKTALLEDARDRAADLSILSARGVESESELPFAALHQLVRPALDDLETLPAPQQRALRGALGLGDRTGDDRFLVSVAALQLLAAFAERRPVLALIDDAHWLDAPSADALLFVARRLDAEGIVMLFAARDDGARNFDAPDLPVLELGGLGVHAAEQLLARHGPVQVAPNVRDQLVEHTGGNPLALLEVPGALSAAQLAGAEPLPAALPLTQRRRADLPGPCAAAPGGGAAAAARRSRRRHRAALDHPAGGGERWDPTGRPSTRPSRRGLRGRATPRGSSSITPWCARRSTRARRRTSDAPRTARWPTRSARTRPTAAPGIAQPLRSTRTRTSCASSTTLRPARAPAGVMLRRRVRTSAPPS